MSSSKKKNARPSWILVCTLALTACAAEPAALTLSNPDQALFVEEVYPILLRDCAFHACHGSGDRFFQVYGPGRGRLSPTTQPFDDATAQELTFSYERARAMIDAAAPRDSLLLRKPLELQAGGAPHEGVDDLGRDVYQSMSERGYEVLARWVLGSERLAP